MRYYIFFVAAILISCSSDSSSSRSEVNVVKQDTNAVKDTAALIKQTTNHAPSIVKSTDEIFDICHRLFVAESYTPRTQKHWHSGYKPLLRNNDTIVNIPVSNFEKAIDGHTIFEQKLKWNNTHVAVYKSKKADFKFIIFSFPDSLSRIADNTKFRKHSRYILHAHSRIKHPNYNFSHGRYVFYFQTRASMFSGEILRIMRKTQTEIKSRLEI